MFIRTRGRDWTTTQPCTAGLCVLCRARGQCPVEFRVKANFRATRDPVCVQNSSQERWFPWPFTISASGPVSPAGSFPCPGVRQCQVGPPAASVGLSSSECQPPGTRGGSLCPLVLPVPGRADAQNVFVRARAGACDLGFATSLKIPQW